MLDLPGWPPSIKPSPARGVVGIHASFEAAVDQVVQQSAQALRQGGRAYFLIYEGTRTGRAAATSNGWQRNQKTPEYMNIVARHFGSVSRKGNMIMATMPIKRPGRSLFDLPPLEREIAALATAADVPPRDARLGVGKRMAGCLYVHRSAWDVLPAVRLKAALAHLPRGFKPVVAKWEQATGCFSFIESARFDLDPEPAIQAAVKVFPDGRTTFTPAKKDPQIYHHKWSFVRSDYTGFDVVESMIRSIAWSGCVCDRSRIGTRSVWESQVLPQLAGATLPPPHKQPTVASPSRLQHRPRT